MTTSAAFLMQEAALLHRRGDLPAAAQRYAQVLTLEKRNRAALFGLATIHCQQGRLDEGIELARRAVKAEPKFAAAHNLIGVAQQRLGRAELALNQFDRAIAAEANFVEAWINRGNVLAALARRSHAIESFSRAIALQPENVLALNARGTALMIDDRDHEAIADFGAAVARDPNFASAFANRGYLLNRLGRFEAAFADLARALALAPNDADVRYHAALVQLLHGQWREGWSNFESRLTAPSLDSARTFIPPPYPRWRGEPPDGGLLVLFTEQGRGDVIQFARFATALATAGHRVAIATQPAYASVFDGATGIERVITDLDDLPVHVPLRWEMLVSVAGRLGVTPDTLPASVPYLGPHPGRADTWRARLGAGFKVGLSWQGSPTFVHDRGRSIPLAAFAPLAEIPDIRLISLQKHPGAEQVASVAFGARIEQVLDAFDTGEDAFRDTAALVANLDLVVASDSMNAHLAGALGRRTYIALRRVPDWRWLLGREDCPWYPTMRLFRQTSEGDWQDVFGRIATAVRAATGRSGSA
jgi:tetratricopeptide (TPR) repeat protein